MSTRATIHFKNIDGEAEAIIYRHGDGDPEELGEDLKAFVKEVKENVPDNRFNCPHYLAAKWVVWDSENIIKMMQKYRKEKIHRLDFLSVGIMQENPGDIDYQYDVVCNGEPTILCFEVGLHGRLNLSHRVC